MFLPWPEGTVKDKTPLVMLADPVRSTRFEMIESSRVIEKAD
jgi:hypothetical protein